MKNAFSIIFSFLFLLLTLQVFAQSTPLSLSPNPSLVGQCPNVTATYTVQNLGSCTGADVIIISGTGASIGLPDPMKPKEFTLTSIDNPQEVKVKVTPKPAGCLSSAEFTIPILSIFGKVPTITGCSDIVIGKSATITLTANLNYPYKGSNDPAQVSGYEWQTFSGGSGWSMTTNNAPGVTSKTATFVTDLQNGATIRVRGVSSCGSLTSDWAICTINRFVQAPCPITGGPAYLVCENTTTFALSATPGAGLTGYTYSWTYPPGWAGVSAGTGALVTPNGLNGGTVTVTAHAYGKSSQPCILNIPLEPIEPLTLAIGGPYVCEGQKSIYKLDITPPPSSQVTWSVSPSSAVTPSSGIGTEAEINASGSYNGPATITFTIVTLCGTVTRTNPFFVGRPKIIDIKVDGKTGVFYLCPRTLGSHYISLTLEGDFDGCIDTWNDFGSTGSSFAGCTTFDFTFKNTSGSPGNYDCVFVNAIATNACGTTTQNIVICPSFDACRREGFGYGLVISPNPANNIVNVEMYAEKDEGKEQLDLRSIQLLDNQGILLKNYSSEGKTLQMDVSNLKEGLYYLRTSIDGEYVIEQLRIAK